MHLDWNWNKYVNKKKYFRLLTCLSSLSGTNVISVHIVAIASTSWTAINSVTRKNPWSVRCVHTPARERLNCAAICSSSTPQCRSTTSCYQCKFCPYTTKYRQALHSHENCRHTQTRVFRCALCHYTTFSNHQPLPAQKKSHGYVPGDVGWLEKYAEKEKEQSSADLTHNFFSKTTGPQTSNSEYREETVNTKESNITIDDSKAMSVNDNENEAIAATFGGPEEMTLVQQASLDIESAREEASNLTEGHPTDEEQCGSPLFASQTSQSSTQMVLAETVNIHDTAFDFESHTLHTVHQNFLQPSADDDDDNAAYCEDQSDSEDLLTGDRNWKEQGGSPTGEMCRGLSFWDSFASHEKTG